MTPIQYTCEGGSFVPRPRPAFCRLQYRKAMGAWYLFSPEHDAIGKWRKFAELTGYVLPVFTRLPAQCSVFRSVASRTQIIVVSYLVFHCSGSSVPTHT